MDGSFVVKGNIISDPIFYIDKRIRIINARKATSNEEKIYHERYKEY